MIVFSGSSMGIFHYFAAHPVLPVPDSFIYNEVFAPAVVAKVQRSDRRGCCALWGPGASQYRHRRHRHIPEINSGFRSMGPEISARLQRPDPLCDWA